MVTSRRTARSRSMMNHTKNAAGIVLTVGVILGAAVAVDERYAHAGDIKQLSAQLERNRLAAEISVLELRRGALQDKVYEGRSRRVTSRSDVEILDRYQRELQDVDRQIRDKQQVLDALPRSK